MYKLHGQITQEFLGLKMRNYQGMALLYEQTHIERFSNLHYCTFKMIKIRFDKRLEIMLVYC